MSQLAVWNKPAYSSLSTGVYLYDSSFKESKKSQFKDKGGYETHNITVSFKDVKKIKNKVFIRISFFPIEGHLYKSSGASSGIYTNAERKANIAKVYGKEIWVNIKDFRNNLSFYSNL